MEYRKLGRLGCPLDEIFPAQAYRLSCDTGIGLSASFARAQSRMRIFERSTRSEAAGNVRLLGDPSSRRADFATWSFERSGACVLKSRCPMPHAQEPTDLQPRAGLRIGRRRRDRPELGGRCFPSVIGRGYVEDELGGHVPAVGA